MQDTWSFELEHALGVETEIGRLRRGDREAFDALLARYQNRLYRYLLRLVRDPSQAEDLFQQTWLRVMTHLDRYDERRPFEPWLFAIARNLAIDHLRRTTPDVLDESSTGALAAKGPDAFETLLERERRSALAERVETLAAIYREALTLRFEEGMTFEEMASLLDCPVSTVKSRVQRALGALRNKMSRR